MTEAEAMRLMRKAELCQKAADRTSGLVKAMWTCHAAELAVLACMGAEGGAGTDGRSR